MTPSLGMGTRAIVSLIYLLGLGATLAIFDHGFGYLSANGPRAFLFVATAVALVFGNYILDPFFSKPADVLVNSSGLVLALVGFAPANSSPIQPYVVLALSVLALFALLLMAIPPRWSGKTRDIAYLLVTRVGRSRVLFSFAYFYAVVAYFDKARIEFWVLLAFLLAVVVVQPLERLVLSARRIIDLPTRARAAALVVDRTGSGTFFLENVDRSGASRLPDLYGLRGPGDLLLLVARVSTDEAPRLRRSRVQAFGIGGNMVFLDQTRGELALLPGPFRPQGEAVEVERDAAWTISDALIEAGLRSDFDRPVGFVAHGSDSERILVDLIEESGFARKWNEGAVLECRIQGEECFLQVISVEAVQSSEESSYRGVYWRASCLKLGAIRPGVPGFKVISWIPLVGETVLAGTATSAEVIVAESRLEVGRVPGLEQPIAVSDVERLVTHNAAFLGALGTGKTSLAIRIASDVTVASETRIVSIDVTDQHLSFFRDRLGAAAVYEDDGTIDTGLAGQQAHIELRSNGARDPVQDPNGSGNVDLFRKNVRKAIREFLFLAGRPVDPTAPVIDGDKRVLVVNPEHFFVTRGEKMGFQVLCVPLSAAEKAQIISEVLLSILMKIGLSADGKARVLLILEEAHTLVPEFSFIAQDGDKSAANGTARVVLQGRKYGLGAFVIAQRTANVSKSILSQCSTVFALRMFDDTGRAFLSNFIGEAHADGLSQLPDQHAVVVGIGVGTEQPVIVRLPTIV